MLAKCVGPPHAHHMVDCACVVTVKDMAIAGGNFIHADRYDAMVVSREMANQTAEVAVRMACREAVIVGAGQQLGFNFNRLREPARVDLIEDRFPTECRFADR